MLSIDEALRAVLEAARPLVPRSVPLDSATGCVLGENVFADIDLPPFDKALVDGYAVRSDDLRAPGADRWLRVGETILAGQTPGRPLGPRETATIMTGAPLPAGADAVVMHERTTIERDRVRVDEPEVRPGQNTLHRGREMRAGQPILAAGTILGPAHLGVLASVGRPRPLVVRPRVCVVSTGDELVEADQVPGPGQIRNSNAVMLRSLALEDRAEVIGSPTAPDRADALEAILGRGLEESDVLLITGGVSAGQRDLVPEVLASLGVRRIFHKVRLKPGKPLWFGVAGPDEGGERDELERRRTLVFGLPGNPVSGLVGYLLFARPALMNLGHRPMPADDPTSRGRLTHPFRHRGERPTYHPSRLGIVPGEDLPRVETLDWAGSADLLTVASADGFAAFPAGDRDYLPGDVVRFVRL